MPDVETAGTLAVPIWLAGAGAAVVAVSLFLAIKRAGGVALISSLFRVGLIALGVLSLWLYVEQRGGSTTGSERRSLDDRKAALVAGAIAPGSALSCLDEIAGETVEAACEKAVPAPRRRQPASRLRWPGHERSPRRSGQRGRGQGRCDAGRLTEHPQSIVKSGPDPPWGVGGRQGEGAAGKRIETSRNWTACPDAL